MHLEGYLVESGGNCIAVSGAWAFVCDEGAHNFNCVDITDVEHPRVVASLTTGGNYTQDLAVQGTTAYLAQGDMYTSPGVQVVDVEDPEDPRLAGELDLSYPATAIAIAGCYAYVSTLGGLVVLDLADPLDPILVGLVGTSSFGSGIAVLGSRLVLSGGSGLTIFDLTDPRDPEVVGVHPGPYVRVAVSETHAYVTGTEGLDVVDISDPTDPRRVGQLAGVPSRAIAIRDDVVFGADDGVSLVAVDVSEPENPRVIGALGGQGGYDIALAGNHVLLAGGALWVLDAANPHNPPMVGTCDLPSGAGCVAYAEGYAYVANDTEFFTVSMDPPADAEILGKATLPPGSLGGIDTRGGYAYVAKGSQVYKIDVHAPDHPSIVSTASIDGGANGVKASDSFVYVAAGRSTLPAGLRVVDFSGSEPELVGVVAIEGWPLGIDMSTTHAFLACTDEDDYPWLHSGLWVIDIVKPRVVGWLRVEECYFRQVILSGTYAHVAGNGGYSLIDVSDPENPLLIASTVAGNSGVAVDGTVAYGIHDRMNVIDISDPALPELIGESAPFRTNGITVAGSVILVASQDGLRVLPKHCGPSVSAPFEMLAPAIQVPEAIPNPTRGPARFWVRITMPGPVEVAVFDLAGRRIRRLEDTAPGPGWWQLQWDGLDQGGRHVAPGIYHVKLTWPGSTTSARLVALR
jgi:hypothetical protein